MNGKFFLLGLVFIFGIIPLPYSLILIFGFSPGHLLRARARVLSARAERDENTGRYRVLVRYRFESLNGERVNEHQVGLSDGADVVLGQGVLRGYRIGGWNMATYDPTDPSKSTIFPDSLHSGIALLTLSLLVVILGTWFVLA